LRALEHDKDASVSHRARGVGLALAGVLILAISAFVAFGAGHANVTPRRVLAIGIIITLAMIAGLFALRRALMRNAFNRNLAALLVAAVLGSLVNRALGFGLDTPVATTLALETLLFVGLGIVRARSTDSSLSNPAPVGVPAPACPNGGETDPPCLTPCPVCGNDIVEFPEDCDLGEIPPESCSGCSAFCQFENCDDGRFCTADSCDVTFGCINQPTPLCHEPTPTVTRTLPTATRTPTPSLTPSPSATRTATPTLNPSVTATPTSTPTSTPTRVLTVTPTASNTVTETRPPEPTATAPPACPGDCNGVGGVTVNELILGVNIALGNTGAGVCPAFDGDASGTVSISELIAAVNAALNGC
jgi:hypothetical protein